MMDLEKMCDKCLRIVADNEDIFGFKLVDKNGIEKHFKGHESCMNDVMETLQQLYGGNE